MNLECDKRNIDKEKRMLEENGDLIESKISFIDKTRVLFNDINKYQQKLSQYWTLENWGWTISWWIK